MGLFRIVCAAFVIVIGSDCQREIFAVGAAGPMFPAAGDTKDAYSQLKDISIHVDTIVPRSKEDASLELRELALPDKRTIIPNLFGFRDPFQPRTPPDKWVYWRHFCRRRAGVYVITEGKGSSMTGCLFGFALVSANIGRYSVDYVEIDRKSRGKGIGKQFTTKVLAQLKDRGAIVDLHNVILPINIGAQLYLTSAQMAGYQFVHILQLDLTYVTMPLVGSLEQTSLFKNFDWDSPDTTNYYMFTMGKNPLYRSFPLETVNGFHILQFNGRQPPMSPEVWQIYIPPQWSATMRSHFDEFSMFFAFSPQDTAEPLGMVLIKVGDTANKILSFSAKDVNDERALLQVTFCDALGSMSPVETQKRMFSHWNTVVEAATSHGYSADNSLVDDVVFVPV